MGVTSTSTVGVALILQSRFIVRFIFVAVQSRGLRNDPEVVSAKVEGAGLKVEWAKCDKERNPSNGSRAQGSNQRDRGCRKHHSR
jgi:hypothetical protein